MYRRISFLLVFFFLFLGVAACQRDSSSTDKTSAVLPKPAPKPEPALQPPSLGNEEAPNLVPYLEEFLSIPAVKKTEGKPYIRGKVVAVDTEEREIDFYIELFLPDELKAQTIEEVGTVIWVKWGVEKTYKYYAWEGLEGFPPEWGYVGYRRTAKITIIDKLSSKVIEQRVFKGKLPKTLYLSGDAEIEGKRVYGNRPDYAIVEYIKNLPRK